MADPIPKGSAQMGGAPNLPDTSQPPPQWTAPKLKTFGLSEIQEHMSEGAWSVFIACVGWAVHWQNMHDGKTGDISLNNLGLFAAPFVGMGEPNYWPIYQQVVSTVFLHTTQDWFEETPEYRKNNSLVWPVIQGLAPLLAQLSKGHSARMAVKDLIKSSTMDVTFR